mgnify:CR=1 FL=1
MQHFIINSVDNVSEITCFFLLNTVALYALHINDDVMPKDVSMNCFRTIKRTPPFIWTKLKLLCICKFPCATFHVVLVKIKVNVYNNNDVDVKDGHISLKKFI